MIENGAVKSGNDDKSYDEVKITENGTAGNEAVFIPAGCSHQARNLKSCTKVAIDTVSPENIHECLRVTEEFRQLPKNHGSSREDKLEMLTYKRKKTFKELETVSRETDMEDMTPNLPPRANLPTPLPPLPNSSQALEAVHVEPPCEIRKDLPSLEPTLHSISYDDVPTHLPQRLFSDGCCPDGRRLNIHSKAKVIGDLVEVLKGTSALKTLLESQFGKLFRFPVARCVNSTKLIHALFCRQLLTKKKYEMWMVFGGKPLRFSLRELHSISGLCCGPFPSDEVITAHQIPGKSQWDLLFRVGSSRKLCVQDVIQMLKNPQLNEWKRLPLALIVLIDGLVICNHRKLRITEELVEMTQDVNFCLEYPWGRKRLATTFSQLGPPLIISEFPNKAKDVARKLQHLNDHLYGFPLPLQLLAFEAIPKLLSKIPSSKNLTTYLQNTNGLKPSTTILTIDDILEVERDPELVVRSMVEETCDLEDSYFMWDDEVEDKNVALLQSLLAVGDPIVASRFQCGDTSFTPCRIDGKHKGIPTALEPTGQRTTKDERTRQSSKRRKSSVKTASKQSKPQSASTPKNTEKSTGSGYQPSYDILSDLEARMIEMNAKNKQAILELEKNISDCKTRMIERERDATTRMIEMNAKNKQDMLKREENLEKKISDFKAWVMEMANKKC